MKRWQRPFYTLSALLHSRLRLSRHGMFDDWWHRVFGRSQQEPDPAALLEHLQNRGFAVSGHFRGDDEGWIAAEITFEDGDTPMQVERYLVSQEGIRAELNSWAAWLETLEENPNAGPLMQHMIGTAQVFTVRQPVRVSTALRSAPLCWEACLFLAQATDGVFQIDGRGFFDAQGTLLVDAEEGE